MLLNLLLILCVLTPPSYTQENPDTNTTNHDKPASNPGAATPSTGQDPPPKNPTVSTTNTNSTPTIDLSIDEDAQLITQPELGHELMRFQIAHHILSTTAQLIGISSGDSKINNFERRYPFIKLLQLSKSVMEKTCLAINPFFYTMAVNSFINLQMETFHLKEPYLSYPALLRIESALRRCVGEAQPHIFYRESNTTNLNEINNNATNVNGSNDTHAHHHIPHKLESEYCDGPKLSVTTNQVIKIIDGVSTIIDTQIPDYATGLKSNGSSPVINEPLIETVWKILVNAHSYCYPQFSDFYNDHHTFTVTMLTLFSNDVQDIWFGKDSVGYDLGAGILYGGLLGDVQKLMENVNNCVGASRQEGVAYPYFLDMPPKDKSNSWNFQ